MEFMNLIILPVLLLIIKTLIGNEILYWISYFECYFFRPFDEDKNPKTHDWLMVFNAGPGTWKCHSVTFGFGWWKGKNGVFLHHYDEEWNFLFKERLTFLEFKLLRKGKIGHISSLPGLDKKIIEMKLS